MLSVWWDYKAILHFELLWTNHTINSNVYVQQFTKQSDAVKKNMPELANRRDIVFQHDSAKPHTSLFSRQKLLKVGWDVLSHPLYSPDLAPSDYHLFRSMHNSLNGKIFNDAYEIKSHLIQFAHKNSKILWTWNYDCLKNGKRSLTKTDNTYWIKFYSFLF